MNQDREEFIQALREVLKGDSKESPLLIQRVPFICADIKGIHESLKDIKEIMKENITQDQFWPIKTLVYSAVGLVLTAVVVAGIAMIIK